MEPKNDTIIKLKTRIKELEKELNNLNSESEKKDELIENFSHIYQNTTIGFYQTSKSGVLKFANKPLVKMLGFNSFDEIKNKNIENFGLIDGSMRSQFLAEISEKGTVVGRETIWLNKSGEMIYVKESAKAVKDANDNVIFYVGTAEDITLQKEKEFELKKSEEQYRDLVDFLSVGIVVHADGNIMFANQGAFDLMDIKRKSDLKDFSIYSYLRKDFHELAKSRQDKIVKSNIFAEPVEMVLLKADGSQINVEISTTKISFSGKDAFLTVLRDISLQKKYEEKIKLSENTYKNILNSVSEAIFIQDKNGVFLNLNKTSEDIFGYSKEELIGNTQKMLSAERKNNMRNITRAIKRAYKGKPQFFEFTGKSKKGKIKPFEVSLSQAEYFGERAVIAVVRDVSKQKKYEQKLIESEKKYRDLINFAVGGILVGDENGYIIEANTHICSLFGRNKKEIIGKHIKDGFFTEECLKKTPFRFDLLNKGEIVINEREIIRPDGTKIHVEMHTKQIPGNRYQSIYHDITARKIAEKQIIESKKAAELMSIKRESLLKAIPDMMFTFDKFGYIIDYYTNTEEQLYVKPEKFIRKNVMEVVPAELGKITIEKIGQVLKTKKIEKYTYALEINNKIKHYDARMVFLDKNSALTVVRDVTDRVMMIEELKSAKEKAEEGQRLASAFLSNLSHEIRTPMNGILGFAELLKDEYLTNEEKYDYIKIIENSGNQLINILNDIIEISRIEARSIKINLVEFDINEMIDSLNSLFRIIIDKKKSVNLIFKTHDSPNIIVSDKTKIQQIISNLVDNAIKFTSIGSVEVGYRIENNNFIEFYVKDTGIGISKNDIDIIFQRFRQGSSSEEAKGGAGLGLSISKAYAELLGGEIRIESEIGVGSVFFVKIPLKS